MKKKEIAGEFFGTFIMMFLGLGAGVVCNIFETDMGLFDVALAWGIAIMIAVFVTRNLSGAHFNPAVSVAMVISGKMSYKKLFHYIISQFFGAVLAAFTVYLLFSPYIFEYEAMHNILRGSFESVQSAKLFGDYYIHPGGVPITMLHAAAAEAVGTFMLITIILSLNDEDNTARPSENLSPIMIGLIVALLITFFSPITGAGFNPIRDFSPRIVTLIFGWGEHAFPDSSGGFFFVYILPPIIGSIIASLTFKKIIKPIFIKKA
jgi:glycerol uptake facilitator protein